MERIDSTNDQRGPQDRRIETLDALQTYIQTQRALLERTQSDIDKLRELRRRAAADPVHTFRSILDYVNVPADNGTEDVVGGKGRIDMSFGTLSELVEEVRHDGEADILEAIDWGAFSGHDPTPLRNLALASRNKELGSVVPVSMLPPPPPPTRQASSPPPHHPLSDVFVCNPPQTSLLRESELQRLVRHHRRTIVDPALRHAAAFLASFPPDSDSGSGTDTAAPVIRGKNGRHQAKDSRDKAKGKGSARRRRTGSAVCGLPDQPADVDVDAAAAAFPPPRRASSAQRRMSSASTSMDVDVPLATSKPVRIRRPSRRLRDGLEAAAMDEASSVKDTPSPKIILKLRLPPRRTPQSNASARADSDMSGSASRSGSCSRFTPVSTSSATGYPKHEEEEEEKELLEEEKKKNSKDERFAPMQSEHNAHGTDTGFRDGKAKPDTHKLPWTLSEQHLLEKLMDDYPHGEKNRWAKISAAMQGRRTPRQVASRVQKYFIKLKKFGVVTDK